MSIIYDAIKKIHGSNSKEKSASYYFGDKNRRKPFLVKLAVILTIIIFLGIGVMYGFKLFSLNIQPKKEVSSPSPPASAQTPAKPSFEKAVELNKKGMDFFKEKKFIDAKASFETALQINPDYAEAYNNLGLTYKQMGNFEAAKENYEEAIRINKDYPEALNNYGLLLSGMGDDKKAVEYFNMAIGADKHYADAFLNMAIVLERQSNIKEAREAYKNFIILAQKKGVDEHMISEVKKHITDIDSKNIKENKLSKDRTDAVKDNMEISAADEQEIRTFLEKWRKDWESKDIDEYMNHYSHRFKSKGMDWNAWKRHKASLNRIDSERKIFIKGIKIAKEGDNIAAAFVQEYIGENKSFAGVKKLYLEKTDDGIKIVGEEWTDMIK